MAGVSMSEFDYWLIGRLELYGCLVYGDPNRDVFAGIALYQRSIGLPETGYADPLTRHYLRQQASRYSDAAHVFFLAMPDAAGSLYTQPMELAA